MQRPRRQIQMDLLGDKNQDMTLEQVLGFVKAKEAGKSRHGGPGWLFWYFPST